VQIEDAIEAAAVLVFLGLAACLFALAWWIVT
jgi:hypothetical protein